MRAALAPLLRGAAAVALLLALAGCDLDVSDPGIVDADSVDPVADARTLSLSARQNFYDAYAELVSSTALYSGELWTGAVRQEPNDIARRAIVNTNIDLNATFWAPLQFALATNDDVAHALLDARGPANDLHLARSSMWGGFSLTLLGEIFCAGVIDRGPPLSPAATLDSAAVRFERAIEVAAGLSGTEAERIALAARVGLGRARLGRGAYGEALAAAAAVPLELVLEARYVDDPQSRSRTGNGVYGASAGNTQIVPPEYRQLGDPRVSFVDAGTTSQDGRNRLFRQTKYDGYADPIRVASGLEAAYLAAEAELALGEPRAALDLIAARRAAAGLPPFAGSGEDGVLRELMSQRARDFWLEAKHLGDALRNPGLTPFVPPRGSPFYKPEQGAFGPLTCLDVPLAETANNPNFPISVR